MPIVENGLTGRNFDKGRNLFGEMKCFVCHRFNNEGGGMGPDLTAISGRFGARDLIEKVINPSKNISDQYAAIVIDTTHLSPDEVLNRLEGEIRKWLTARPEPAA